MRWKLRAFRVIRNARRKNMKRPKGISILSILHLIGGVSGALLIAPVVAEFNQSPEASQIFNAMGIPPLSILINIILILTIALASGIGMWNGKKWGWYLGSFYYLYSVFRNAGALISIPRLCSQIPPQEMETLAHQPSYYYAKHATRVVVHFLLYLYFFKGNVRDFFAVSEQKKWKPVIIELGTCLAISGVGIILSLLCQ